MVKSNSRKKPLCKVGDRISDAARRVFGTCISNNYTSIVPYKILWDNGHEGSYKASEIEEYGYLIHAPEPKSEDIEEEELNLWEVCGSSTSAQELVLDSRLQQLSLENLISGDFAKSTSTAEISLPLDIQEYQSTEISKTWTAHEKQSKLLQPRPRVSRSVSKGKGLVLRTKETVSPQSYEQSQASNLDSLRSKTSKDCSHAPIDLNSKLDISLQSSTSFPAAGTMSSGKWLPADTLDRLSLESDYYWLDSPSALSSDSSRPPGQSKLEAQLKKLGYLENGECINPKYLEDAFTIPLGWCDHLVSQSAIQLLEEREKRSETASTPGSQPSPSEESFTSNQSENNSLLKSRQTGSIYQYTANKANKLACIQTYPKVEGDRKRDEDSHWYWGFSYVEKERGKWRDKSAAIPRKKLGSVRAALRAGKSYKYILQEILGK